MNCYLNLKIKKIFDKIDIILSVFVCFLIKNILVNLSS